MCGEGQKLLTLTLPVMTRLLHLGTSASASVIQASTSRTVNAARPHTLQLATDLNSKATWFGIQ